MSKKFYSIANFISNCISRFFLGKTMNNDENIKGYVIIRWF